MTLGRQCPKNDKGNYTQVALCCSRLALQGCAGLKRKNAVLGQKTKGAVQLPFPSK